MLTKVEVRTLQGDLLSLQLDDISDGFVVQEVTGLDPVKATLVSSSFAGLDGEQYQSSNRSTRNITMTIGLDPDPATDTVRGLRKRLYNFFMPKSPISLRFYMEDGLVVDILGRVESCESAIFTPDPAMNISIINFDPDFYDPIPVDLPGFTVSDPTDTFIPYAGTVDTGMVITLNVDRSVGEFTIYHRTPDDTIRSLDFSAALVSGDVLTISTVSGSKSVTLTHLGSDSSALSAVSPQSNWTTLMPGNNYFRIYASGAAIPYTIEYITKYGGL